MSQNTVLFEIAYAPINLTTDHVRIMFEDETENGVTCIVEETRKQVRWIKGKKYTTKFKYFTVTAICKRFMFSDADEHGRIVRFIQYVDSGGVRCETKLKIQAKHY